MNTAPDLIEQLRQLAADSVSDALSRAEALLETTDSTHSADPAFLYFVAELRTRVGRPHDALDMIDEAQRRFRENGHPLLAERCEIGRAVVLEDLGRLDEAIEAATRQLDRLRTSSRTPDVLDLEVRALVNRGSCSESIGRYAAALADFDLAVSSAALRGDEHTVALIQINRANVLDALGRTSEALVGLRAAEAVLNAEGDREDRVKVSINIAATLCRRGEYDEGLAWFDAAEQLVEAGTIDEAAISVEVAEALAAVGGTDEAVARYRDALEVLADMPLSWLEGRAWLGLGVCAGRLGDRTVARSALRSAIDAFVAADNLPSQIAALLELATVESDELSNREFALGQARRALALADPSHWPVQACIAQLKLADLSSGGAAERALRSAMRLAKRVQLTPLTMRVEQRLGAHLLRSGRSSEAAEHVREAVRLADSLRRRLSHGTLLRSFPSETASCYSDLIEVCLGSGDIEGAAAAADRARSRSLADLGAWALGGSTRPGTNAVEAELHSLYDRLLGVGELMDSERRRQLERHAHELEAALDRLEFELRPVVGLPTAGPAGANDQTVDDGMLRAESAEVVQLTYVIRDDSIDLVVKAPSSRPRWFRHVTSVSSVVAVLERFQAEGRRAHAIRSTGLQVPDAMLASVHKRLADLGSMLMAPLRDELASASPERPVRLAISPAGPLHLVPFAALEVAGCALVDVAEIAMCPSHAVRRESAVRRARNGPTVLVGLSEGGIAGVDDEVSRLSELWPDSFVLRGSQATIDAVVRAANGASLLHLATHGLFRPSAPLRSGVRLTDGWLTASRAAALDLSGSTVVLSACDTGRATVTGGDEVLGLQYGFLAAGARNVVMSLWPAHDRVTVDLMTALHREIAKGAHTPTALRTAQRTARDSDPHPWFWATFMCSGAA